MESASVSLVSLDSFSIPGGCLSSPSDINDPINYALNEANEAITLSFGLSVNYGRGIDVILLWIMLFFSLILVTDDTVFYSFVCQSSLAFLRVVIIKLHLICSLVMLSFQTWCPTCFPSCLSFPASDCLLSCLPSFDLGSRFIAGSSFSVDKDWGRNKWLLPFDSDLF